MRWVLAAMIVILSAVGLVSQQPSEAPTLYEGVPADAALLKLDRQALDEAYHEQIKKLFGVWVSSGAPAAAAELRNGLRLARRAYNQALAQIVKREQELLEEERKRQE